MNNEKVGEILKFWFEDIEPKQHFVKDPEFDKEVKERFEETYWHIMNGEVDEWAETPEGRLAMIIVLDQFSRNMFRDDAQSFAGDEKALALAIEGVERGDDKRLQKEQQLFMYMPYMHSESKEVHEKALQIFTEYGNELNLEYEIKHKAIIDRFGRYPHRNAVLGRESTEEEIEFNKEHGGF